MKGFGKFYVHAYMTAILRAGIYCVGLGSDVSARFGFIVTCMRLL